MITCLSVMRIDIHDIMYYTILVARQKATKKREGRRWCTRVCKTPCADGIPHALFKRVTGLFHVLGLIHPFPSLSCSPRGGQARTFSVRSSMAVTMYLLRLSPTASATAWISALRPFGTRILISSKVCKYLLLPSKCAFVANGYTPHMNSITYTWIHAYVKRTNSWVHDCL